MDFFFIIIIYQSVNTWRIPRKLQLPRPIVHHHYNNIVVVAAVRWYIILYSKIPQARDFTISRDCVGKKQ